MALDPPFANVALQVPEDVPAWLQRFHLWLDFKTRLYETDANGHMSQLTYFGWQETGAAEYWTKLGHEDYYASMAEVSMFMGEQYCRFVSEVRYAERIRLGVRCARMGNSSVTLEYAFVHPDESLAAMGINSQVLVKVATREAQPLPHELREAILRQEGHSPG
jgi:acyl-CoA thioester hydrolase